MNPDRSLMLFYSNATDAIEQIVDVGFEDLPALAGYLRDLRNEIDQIERRATAIADEQAERMNEPPDAGWVPNFNRARV